MYLEPVACGGWSLDQECLVETPQYDPRLIVHSALRFSLRDGLNVVSVIVPPLANGRNVVRARIEYAGRAPRFLALRADAAGELPPVDEVAQKVCDFLKIGPVQAEEVQQNILEPAIPALLSLSPAGPRQTGIMPPEVSIVEVAVAFADLRGFTAWSGQATPQAFSDLFDVISDAVGMILTEQHFDYWKLLGDGVMLVWHAGNNPRASVFRAVSAVQQLILSYSRYHEQVPDTPVGFGAGICFGNAIDFRSAKFFDSCMVRDYYGSVINSAARLQGLAGPGEILTDYSTAMLLEDEPVNLQDCTEALAEGIASLKGIDSDDFNVYCVQDS